MTQDKARRAINVVFSRILCNQGVRGSNPLTSTNLFNGLVATLGPQCVN
jgi:hypothetical protein